MQIPTQCNLTLLTIGEERVESEEPLFGNVSFHQFGLYLSAGFALVATVVALILIFLHATHYSNPNQQRHIIRIIFMIPIYAVISFISFKFFRYALYWQVIMECYEAFAIASFFHLLCHYLEPNLNKQKEYFRHVTPKNWLLPLNWIQSCTGGKTRGPLRLPRSGLTWFNIIWIGVFQYCFIRVLFTFVSLITQLLGRYCESSLSPAFAHLWVMIFQTIAVTIAMYCLIQFYYQTKEELKEHKPFLKILCIKLVIFFSFWQTLLISFLSSGDKPVIATGPRVSYVDVKVGIPSVLLCIEMAIFSILHIFAFPWRGYDVSNSDSPNAHYQGGWLGFGAILDALNPLDFIKAILRGFRWLFVGRKHRTEDISYQNKQEVTSSDGQKVSKPFVNETEEEFGVTKSYSNGEQFEMERPKHKFSNDAEDQAALLHHQQQMPHSYPDQSYNRSATNTPPMYGSSSQGYSQGYGQVPPASPGLASRGFQESNYDSRPSAQNQRQQRPDGRGDGPGVGQAF